jgi:hypothetical protein
MTDYGNLSVNAEPCSEMGHRTVPPHETHAEHRQNTFCSITIPKRNRHKIKRQTSGGLGAASRQGKQLEYKTVLRQILTNLRKKLTRAEGLRYKIIAACYARFLLISAQGIGTDRNDWDRL